MKRFLSFLTLTCLCQTAIFSQSIPDDDLIPICDGQSITTGAPGNSGITNITLPCNEFQPLSPFIDFYYIKILSGTTFTFMVNPIGNDDYDFAAYLNPNWSNLAATPTANKRGSQNDPFQTGVFHLGLSLTATDTCEPGGSTGNPEPGVVRYFNVQPDDEILIAIDRWSQTTQGYTISFGGDAVLDCTILGNSYGKCDVDGNGQESFVAADFLPDLNADFPGSVYEFYEDQNDAETGTGPQVTFPYVANFTDNPSTLFVRVETATGAFQRVVQIFLYVNRVPELESPVDLPELCDLNGDGEEIFDLTQAEALLVTDPSLYTFKYYEQLTDAQAGNLNVINPADAYSSGNATVYVRVETGELDGNPDGCFAIGEINLILTDELESEFSLNTTYCLDSVPPVLPSVSDNGITGNWSPAVINTSAPGIFTFTFTPNPGQCALAFELEIEVTDQILPEFSLPAAYCVNETPPALPGISDNGITGTWNPAVIDTGMPGTFTYTFIPDEGLCSAEIELEIEITEGILPAFDMENTFCVDAVPPVLPSVSDNGIAGTWNPSVIDTGTPGITTYTFTPDNNDCTTPFEIEIEIIIGVELNQVNPISLCDDDFDGIYQYNLTQLNSQLISPTTGLSFSYYASQQNADNDIPIPQNQWNAYEFATLPAGIWVIAETNDGCRSEIIPVQFVAGQQVQHTGGPLGPFGYCEEETIDLTQYESSMTSESGVNFTYYTTLLHAQNESDPLANTGAYTPDGSVFVRLEKEGRCPAILEITFEALEAPAIEGIPSGLVLCEGQETIEVEAGSDDPNATYLWEWGNGQTHSGPLITISESGVYSLTVTGANGCGTTEQFTVETASQPVITAVVSGTDYFIVSAQSGSGTLLEYSLNGVIWQASPRFDNLIKGEIYTVYVRENGCMVTSYKVVILDVSNFISPNGDGYNDFWEIRGIEVTPEATIKIFDRYGKMFVDTNFEGNYLWDGKYNGASVPAGDYWYILEIPSDGVAVAKKFVGHISIRN